VATRVQLAAARSQAEEAQAKARSLEDNLERQRIEHEAALAALRSQLARETLQRHEEAPLVGEAKPKEGETKPQDLTPISAEERMSAFRQHLQEVHQREIDENSQKRLSARLSRLWNRTGPKG
jgi:hypothetical protein